MMVDWLKEQALFDHLLHGLFKFLNETTSIKELKYDEVEGMYTQRHIHTETHAYAPDYVRVTFMLVCQASRQLGMALNFAACLTAC